MNTATNLRKNIFTVLDQIEKTQKEFVFSRKGKAFSISLKEEDFEKKGRLSHLKKRKALASHEDINEISWIDNWSAGKDL